MQLKMVRVWEQGYQNIATRIQLSFSKSI